MMGVITEDRMGKVIKNMIDSVGIESTIRMVDDYNLIDSYLTDEDKINYIKDQFQKINDGNYFSLEQIWGRPIRIKVDDENRIHQIEGLHRGNVTIVVHKEHGAGVTKYYRKYEELSSEIIDKLFRMMLSQYIKI
jgi:hypothetical protein